MAKYCLKVAAVDAVQWFKDGDHPKVFVQVEPSQVWVRGQSYVHTDEGQVLVKPGDWVLTGPDGGCYTRSDTVFKRLYEPVVE